MNSVDKILSSCDETLRAYYGSRYRGLYLFGSVARGEQDAESDLDLLVLLEEPFDMLHELRCLVEVLHPVQLESDRLISAKPASEEALYSGKLQLYRNVLAEGMEVA